MTSVAIVKHFNVINDVSLLASSLVLYCEKNTRSVLRLPKKLSATALTLNNHLSGSSC